MLLVSIISVWFQVSKNILILSPISMQYLNNQYVLKIKMLHPPCQKKSVILYPYFSIMATYLQQLFSSVLRVQCSLSWRGLTVVYLPASAKPPRRLGVWKPNTVDPLIGVLQSVPRPTKQVELISCPKIILTRAFHKFIILVSFMVTS